jgi:hypothetical protein
MSKDNEEQVRKHLLEIIETRKQPKELIIPTNTNNNTNNNNNNNNGNKEDIKEKVKILMNEIDYFYENENEIKKEIKFTD